MMIWPVTSLLAHLWHPKRANERQLPTNTVGRRARLDDGSGAFLPVAVACNERPVRVGQSRSAEVGGLYGSASNEPNIERLRSLAAFDHVDGYALAFPQLGDTGPVQRRGMHKNVLAATVPHDESEPFIGGVELHRADLLDP